VVDLLKFFWRRIGTSNIEMPILHKVVICIAARRLAPVRKLHAALSYERRAFIL